MYKQTLNIAKMNEIKTKVKKWLEGIAMSESLPEEIVAVNIGMFETEGGYALYLCGSEEYDEEDSDWACDPAFELPENYLMFTGRDFESIDWETFLKYVIDALKEILDSGNTAIDNFFGQRIVTAGFDDGDLIRIK